tara:strand:- start:267 stop:3323 length:3057 start_codon:yes stop_codon:yes gene_type:complete
MSWRTEASNIRAGIAKGDYKKKRNYAKAFMEPFQRGIERQEIERIQKDKEDRARAASEAKAAAAAQTAKDKADKKLQSMVTLAMITNDIPVTKENNSTMLNLAATTGITSVDGFSTFVKDFVKYDEGRSATPINTVEGTLPPEMQLRQDQVAAFDQEEVATAIVNFEKNKKGVENGDYSQQYLEDFARKAAKRKSTEIPMPDPAAFAATEAKQMKDLGLDSALDRGADPSFTLGKKSSLTKIKDITEANFRGLIFSAQQRGDEADVANIQGVADSNKWSILLGDKTEAEVMGMSLDDFTEYSSLYYNTLDPAKKELVDNIKVQKEATDANEQYWNNPLEMQKMDVNVLEGLIGSGVIGPDTSQYLAIENHLKSRKPFELALKVEKFDSNTFIGQTPEFFEDWLEVNSQRPEFKTKEGAEIITRALRMLSNATLRVQEDEKEAQLLRSPKDQALQAWFTENGFNTPSQGGGPAGNVIKTPGSGDLAAFEVQWEEALKASRDKDLWENISKVQNLDVDTLTMIVDAGLLPEGSKELKTVKAALEQRSTQETADKVIESITLPSNINTVLEAELWLIRNPDTSRLLNLPENSEYLKSFKATKERLLKEELGIKNGALSNKAANLYDLAAKEFLAGLDPNIKGPAKIDALANWERDWKASIAPLAEVSKTYTTANYTQDLIKYSEMMTNPNPEVRLVGFNWMKNSKPIIEDSLETVRNFPVDDKIQNLIDLGIGRIQAKNIVNGVIKLSTDQFGNVSVIDWRTMGGVSLTPPPQQQTPSQQVSVEAPEVITSVNIPFQAVDGSGKTITVTEEEAQEAAETLSGLAGQINNLEDIRSGFGLEGFASKIGNSIFEPLGLTINPASQETQSTFKALKTVTILQLVTAVPGIRDSVSLKRQLSTLLSDPGKFTGTPEKVLRELNAVKAFIETSLSSATANASSTRINAANISKNTMAINSLTNLAEIYDIAILKMGGGKTPGGADITDSIFLAPGSEDSEAAKLLKRLKALRAAREANTAKNEGGN